MGAGRPASPTGESTAGAKRFGSFGLVTDTKPLGAAEAPGGEWRRYGACKSKSLQMAKVKVRPASEKPTTRPYGAPRLRKRQEFFRMPRNPSLAPRGGDMNLEPCLWITAIMCAVVVVLLPAGAAFF